MGGAKGFASDLREFRAAAGLTQAELADRARVSRRTIIRWEAGLVSPWVPELKAVLQALECSAKDTARILAELPTRRSERETGNLSHATFGPFLRALRLRNGLGVEGLGAAMGCDASTVVRWEGGELKPNRETAKKLWRALLADPAELEALEALENDDGPFDLAAAEEEIEGILWPWDPLALLVLDLRFLDLLRRLSAHAKTEAKALPYLAAAHCHYSEKLFAQSRFHESEIQASRAEEICTASPDVSPEVGHLSAILRARCLWHRQTRRAARRGLEILDCLAFRPLNLDHYSLRLISYAEYHALEGRPDRARKFVASAVDAVRHRRPDLAARRSFDQSRILLHCGDADAALKVLPPVGDRSPADIASEALLWRDILSAVGRHGDAERWRAVATEQIRAFNLQRRFGRV